MGKTAFGLLSAILVLASVAPAPGQVLERPVRGLFGGEQPADPDRAWRSLTFIANTLGGFDDNLTPSGGGLDLQSAASGYTGYADAGLSFRRGRRARTFEIAGRGYLNSFRNVGLTPSYGGTADVNFTTPLGRYNSLTLSQNLTSAPFFTPAAFGSLRAGDVALPEDSPTNGFSSRRSTSTYSSMSLRSTWSRRNTVSADLRYARQDFEDDLGDGFTGEASLRYSRTIGRRSGVNLSYRHARSEFLEQSGTNRPTRDQTADLGYSHERHFSPTRRLSLSLGAGATYVESIDASSRESFDHLAPSGYGAVRFDWARTWSVSADYRRAVARLDGLVSDPFMTDAVLATTGGFVARSSEVVLSAGYSDGQVPGESEGRLDSYFASMQFRRVLTPLWSAIVNYTFYTYRLRGLSDLPRGFPPSLDRNAVRVGIALNLPLYGSGGQPGAGPNR